MSSTKALSMHRGDVDVVYYTTTNALFNAEIKTIQLHCICYENDLFKPVKVKIDGSFLYRAIATHIMLCCLHDVWAIHQGKNCTM